MNPNSLHEMIAAQRTMDLYREAEHERLINTASHATTTNDTSVPHHGNERHKCSTPWLWRIYVNIKQYIEQQKRS